MSAILRLRGLPYSATEEDIRNFFSETPPASVYVATKNGKNTGEAYVEFGSAADAKKALHDKQHQNMGTRYIEIFMAGEADLLAQTSGEGGEGGRPSLQGHVVRLRGLPFSSTAQDVLQFFEGVGTVGGEAGVVFTCNPDGRPTGEAYVALEGPEAVAAALERHKERIGSRYIEVFESSKGDMFQAVQQHGYFTTEGPRRRHHGHSPHGGPHAQGLGHHAPDAGGGGGRARGTPVDDVTSAFAGFGLSQRDVQVPGPPRWGAYAAPADQQYQQYPPRQVQPGAMPPGALRWRAMPGGGGMQRPGGMLHFNPAPGPPPGKGGRPGGANGSRQAGPSGGAYAVHESWGGHGGGPALVFNPFMVQHPLMVPHTHTHTQHASPWGTAGMVQQQGGAWYAGGVQVGRMAHGMPQMASAYHHHAYPPGFYPIRGAPGQGSSHTLNQHPGAAQQLYGSHATASGGQAAGGGADASRSQPAPRQTPAQPGPGVGSSAAGTEEQPAAQPAAAPAAEDPAVAPPDPAPAQT